jgi:ribosomal protein S18 acetylase RimI-like enzyme
MKGVEEVHLLNITVAPEYQRQGWSRVMLEALAIWARGQGAQWLWLEVRVGNVRAMQVYERTWLSPCWPSARITTRQVTASAKTRWS